MEYSVKYNTSKHEWEEQNREAAESAEFHIEELSVNIPPSLFHSNIYSLFFLTR